MTKLERISMIEDYLAEEGYRPTTDDDGDLRFKLEGSTYFVILDDDPTFFRLAYANFWPIEDERERRLVQEACNDVTATIKVAKVFPANNNVSATVELYASPPQSVLPVVQRSIGTLQAAVVMFRNKMSEHMAVS